MMQQKLDKDNLKLEKMSFEEGTRAFGKIKNKNQ